MVDQLITQLFFSASCVYQWQEYKYDYTAYVAKAKQWTRIHATDSLLTKVTHKLHPSVNPLKYFNKYLGISKYLGYKNRFVYPIFKLMNTKTKEEQILFKKTASFAS